MQKKNLVFIRCAGLFIVIFACAALAFAQESANIQNKNSLADNALNAPPTNASVTETNETVAAPPQTSEPDGIDAKNELSVWGGFAPDMPRVFGGSRPSSYGQVAVRYSRRIATMGSASIKYTIDFIPLAILKYDRRPIIQTAPNTFVTQSNDTTAYAYGLTPVGFQLHFRRKAKIQPFLSANAGLLIFNKSIPDDRSLVLPEQRGRQFNFTLAGGGGVDFLTDAGRTFTVGFKFHHISNASTGNINPGFDQNLFYVGYTFKKW